MKVVKVTKGLGFKFYDGRVNCHTFDPRIGFKDNEPEHNKRVFKMLVRSVLDNMNKREDMFISAGLKAKQHSA